jgi:uncharacterized protein YbaP (TraB family)
MQYKLLVVITIFLNVAGGSHAQCVGGAPPPTLAGEITDTATREVANHPDRYVNGHARFWQVSKSNHSKGILWGALDFTTGRAAIVPTRALIELDKATDFLSEVDLGSVSEQEFRRHLSARPQAFSSQEEDPNVAAVDTSLGGALSSALRKLGYPSAQYPHLTLFGAEAVLSAAGICYDNALDARAGMPAAIVLAQRAAFLKKPTFGMESADEQWQTMSHPGDTIEAEVIPLLIRRASQNGPLFSFFLDAYNMDRPDLGFGAEVSWLATQAERDAEWKRNDTLTSGRNEKFANSIDRQFDSPGYHFAVVGFLHLMGSDGVIERLRQKGWVLEPIPTGPSSN